MKREVAICVRTTITGSSPVLATKKKKKIMKIYLAHCLHSSDSDSEPSAHKTYGGAIDAIHEHFLSYGFEIKDGRPFDSGNDDGREGGFEVFSGVLIVDNKVAQFTHCDGEGPIGFITKTNLS